MFSWPSTDAPGGDGGLTTRDWLEEGVLAFVGYRVGTTNGEVAGTREHILSQVFEGPIPPAFPPPYLAEWGAPASVQRLRKMAETIAAFARNAKRRRSSGMDSAIRDWEQDLEYLYYRYYVDRFHFAWPSSAAV